MKQTSKTSSSRPAITLLLTVFTVIISIAAIAIFAFYIGLKAETHARYVGLMNLASEKIAKTAWGVEMNANNVFDEVGKHLESPDAVVRALESKASLNPEVRGYFAAFVPEYFPQKGMWFEPYVHQNDSGLFEVTMVGSARHDYTKSEWYLRANKTHGSFWSDPYYYYDGTNISGHYCTFVKPIFNAEGSLSCVCGADMTFEWLANGLKKIDQKVKDDRLWNQYLLGRELDFFLVVLNNDGTCIASPEGKQVAVTDEDVITDLSQNKSGVADLEVNGMPCTVYYGPIDHVNWSVAVVVPTDTIWQMLNRVELTLLVVVFIALLMIWMIYRRTRYAETD